MATRVEFDDESLGRPHGIAFDAANFLVCEKWRQTPDLAEGDEVLFEVALHEFGAGERRERGPKLRRALHGSVVDLGAQELNESGVSTHRLAERSPQDSPRGVVAPDEPSEMRQRVDRSCARQAVVDDRIGTRVRRPVDRAVPQVPDSGFTRHTELWKSGGPEQQPLPMQAAHEHESGVASLLTERPAELSPQVPAHATPSIQAEPHPYEFPAVEHPLDLARAEAERAQLRRRDEPVARVHPSAKRFPPLSLCVLVHYL
ncbi:MAG: hypothetical protein J7513_03265 [Solirubrobacteraceae bacterium]|nr:hypothetical protein [Solirubrobacteraceae bacterium]